MRDFAAILLIGILLFNWLGYRVLDNIAENDAAHRLETRLDRQQYDDHQLVSIKVPLTHLAYYNVSTAFERVEGEIDVNGVPYHYVKRRIYNDSVEMLCIPSAVEFKLRQFNNDYFRLVNDMGQGSKPGSHQHAAKSFGTDPYVPIHGLVLWGPAASVVVYGEQAMVFLPLGSLPTDERPPAAQIA